MNKKFQFSDDVVRISILEIRNAKKLVAIRFGDTVFKMATTAQSLHFGGFRRWFICPLCDKRVGILYYRNNLACRKCNNIVYRSQYVGKEQRKFLNALKKLSKVNEREAFKHRNKYHKLQASTLAEIDLCLDSTQIAQR
ncbi:hypothetical protein [Desulfovibrio sp. DV]|uniref:hypothetical protein n=1 Tax=Desulfovibrio sp. DV TaxID=1844708 RepID=UPI000AA8D9F8|nr:hypothetical protein [Desulfovibrio sp. DV]